MNDEEIKKRILKEIDAAHESLPNRGIKQNRERLLNDLIQRRRYEIRNGKVVNQNGILQNIASDVDTLISVSPYIAAAQGAKFVSRFVKPLEDDRRKMIADTENVLKKFTKIKGIVPLDQQNYDRAIGILAASLVWESAQVPEIDPVTKQPLYNAGDVVFSKWNDDVNLPSDQRFTVDQVFSNISHLIDTERTSFSQDLKKSSQRKMARELIDAQNPRAADIEEKIRVIQKNEMRAEIPNQKVLPRFSRTEVEREFQKQEAAISGYDFETITGGMRQAHLNKASKRAYESLNDTSGIQAQLKQIQPNTTERYDGITYE